MRRGGLPLTGIAKEIRHSLGRRIAGVVEARQSEASLDRPEQGEMSVELPAPQFVEAVVGVYDGDHLVDDRLHRVIVFVPDHDDRAVTVLPRRGAVNRGHNLLHGLIPQDNQCRVQAGLGAIVVRIKIAEGGAVATSVLVVALVGHDVRETRDLSRA